MNVDENIGFLNDDRSRYEKETTKRLYALITQVIMRILDHKSEIGKVHINNGKSAWPIVYEKAHNIDYALAMFKNGQIGLVRRICFINGETCNFAFIKEVDFSELNTIECTDPIISELFTLSDFFKGLMGLALKSGVRIHDIETWKNEYDELHKRVEEFVSGF